MLRRLLEPKNKSWMKNTSWTSMVILSDEAIHNLLFWRDQLKKWNGLSFLPETPEIEIFTDANDTAWGVVIGHKSYSGLWKRSEATLHINCKELLAVLIVLILKEVVGQSVLIYPENTTTLAYVRKFDGTTSLKLLSIAERLWENCMKTNNRPQARTCCDTTSRVGRARNAPAQEPNCTDIPEDETRADKNDFNITWMNFGDLVSGNFSTIDFTATNSTSNRGSPRSEKRKVPAHQKQGMDSNGMENQRSALKDKGVSNTAIELIFNSHRTGTENDIKTLRYQ
ncbi:hypothetical protein AYI70_g321 [Smittium culicis]|uniref:Reverse transcriptase RNase H-like domain-containing protein n=1 Tax=Smittium culicis TaxID=133412 RepID=A0A1R1YH55_9FUNG|nr:hypothetical protein AYI70_g321 [Smittium culicis]